LRRGSWVGDILHNVILQQATGVSVVDAKSAPSAKHTASRTSWLHTRRDHKTC
jgi:hypothetical protein